MRGVLGIIVLVLIVGVFSSLCVGEERRNGYWWNERDLEPKYAYILGWMEASETIYEGLWMGGLQIEQSISEDLDLSFGFTHYEYRKYIYSNWEKRERLGEFPVGDVVDRIDVFYSNPENRAISLFAVIRVVGWELNGVSDEKIEEEIRRLKNEERIAQLKEERDRLEWELQGLLQEQKKDKVILTIPP